MTMGGAGPVNKNIDIARFHGHGEDSFGDYNSATAKPPAVLQEYQDPYMNVPLPPRPDGGRPSAPRKDSFNPSSKVEQVHGDESLGLGTSTFLEGAPAPRTAIRRESEGETGGAGLSRKMSLAKRIRGLNGARPKQTRYGTGLGSPEPRYEASPGGVQSAGGRRNVNESNPFFHDYDQAYDKKTATIKIAESGERERDRDRDREATGVAGSAKPLPVPNALQRSRTSDDPGAGARQRSASNVSMGGGEEPKTGGGFLSRVKSLRGGRRGGKSREES